MEYIAFDVETPNRYSERICAVGMSGIQQNSVVWTKSWLVDPECDFDAFCCRIHGIYPETVAQSPAFPELWEEIGPILRAGIVVAHNAQFDMRVLQKTLCAYEIEETALLGLCTVRMARREIPGMPDYKLPTLCRYVNCSLDHHDAGSDSRGCAEILCHMLRNGADPAPYIRQYAMN